MVSCYDDLTCVSGESTMSTIHDCCDHHFDPPGLGVDYRKLVIAQPASMVRAEKVVLSGMYGVACMECVYYLIVCIKICLFLHEAFN